MQVWYVYNCSKYNILKFPSVTLEGFVIVACKGPQTHKGSSDSCVPAVAL